MILVNKIRCLRCGEIIESTSGHDFKWCSCKACAVDGGHDYLRRLGKRENWEELSEQNDELPDSARLVCRLHEPKQMIELYSEKYDTHGLIEDFGFARYLSFKYNDIKHFVGLWDTNSDELKEKGLEMMENYIGYLTENPTDVFLHYWHIDREDDNIIAHGIVSGHPRLEDTARIHTSPVENTLLDIGKGELVVYTHNTVYHCSLKYCEFEKQDDFPELIENYDRLKEEYKDRIDFPEIEHGKILLVLSDFDEYYFHSLCVKDENGKPKNYTSFPKIGTFSDSYFIQTDDGSVSLRYFPDYKRIVMNTKFFSSEKNSTPIYVENIGSSTIYVNDDKLEYRLDPGERKELTEENAGK